MAYTTTELITNSYYLSGVVSRDFETVSGSQLADGLRLLNDLLAVRTADSQMVPYYSKYELTAVIGQEEYFIPNLIQAETFTFNIGDVRYETSPVGRRDYFGAGRVDNIQALPFNYHIEPCLNGSNLYVYFEPSDLYPMTLWGKFSIGPVTLGQNLPATFDDFYQVYLKYGLSKYICNFNRISFTQDNLTELERLEAMIKDFSPPDLKIKKISTLRKGNSGLNWGDVNTGHGWRP